jgi:hypothetical protein
MKVQVQFLTKSENQVKPLSGKNEIQLLDERKSLNSHIKDAFDLIEKHEQKEVIIGFNIVEVHSFQNREIIVHQNIFDY